MSTRPFHFRHFLRQVYGTEPFLEYCQVRGIAFEQLAGWLMHEEDYDRWQGTFGELPEPVQARVELELVQVHELANAGAIAALIAAAQGRELPPDAIPGKTAVALWFFLRHADLFQSVFLRQEIAGVDSWRIARAAPGIVLDDLPGRGEALGASLREFFRALENTGRFCVVDTYRMGEAMCFIAHLADRLRLSEIFTEGGQHTTQASRPAFPVVFVYEPSDGRVFLKARQRAAEKILDLFQRFGQTVLGVALDERSLDPIFFLDLFKWRFDPPRDAEDMESVRVKALHLAYPGRAGRRRLKLETLAADGQFAILDLLKIHGGGEYLLEQLEAVYAELLVKMQADGRSKHHLIRLWPDRCSLDQSVLGDRLRKCLMHWNVLYAPRP